MMYADDANIIEHTHTLSRACIFIIERYCSLYDISINAQKKTKMDVFWGPQKNNEVKVNGTILETVTSFIIGIFYKNRIFKNAFQLDIKRIAVRRPFLTVSILKLRIKLFSNSYNI